MSNFLPLLRVVALLSLVLPTSCATSRESAPDELRPRATPKPVRVAELPEGQLKLTFEPAPLDPDLDVLEVGTARAILADLYGPPRPAAKSRLRLVLASTGPLGEVQGTPTAWERRLKEEFLSRYGPALVPLPESLEASPLVLALRRSPRYMGSGAREAAQELFSSPPFLISVALSVGVYFAAWLLPEPLFSKALVATLTLRLALAVGVVELTQVAHTCLRLYREVQAARTVQELEAAAEHFGKAMGGTALRVLVLVASFGVGKGLPEVPEGGLRTLLSAPRYVMAEGASVEGATAVQIVSDGTLIVAGAAVGTAVSLQGSACADGSEKKDGHNWHHLATDKNNTSSAQGGPWTLLFKRLFAKAGMDLNAAENLVYLAGHKGPHPAEYHAAIHQRLQTALAGCETLVQCKNLLVEELRRIASEVCTPGSQLHRLLTRTPP
jgi:hypothetical protein